jgi:hypothetical protein
MSDTNEPDAEKMVSTVEVDECFVDAQPKAKPDPTRKYVHDKTGVLGIAERGGALRLVPIGARSARNLHREILTNVDTGARIMTDDWTGYRSLGRAFKERGHHVVNHSKGEYVRANGITTNTIESAFSLFKRGLFGVYHVLSKRHLARYCAEFSFRWTWREASDLERAEVAIRKGQGKRLTYAQHVAGLGA